MIAELTIDREQYDEQSVCVVLYNVPDVSWILPIITLPAKVYL